MNIIFKNYFIVLLVSLATLSATTVAAVDFTGRFSMLGTTARASQGDIGYVNKDNYLSADQQSLRLMLDNSRTQDETCDKGEWSVHVKMTRLHLSDIPFSDVHSSDLFRVEPLSSYWLEENDANNTSRFGYEVDRAVYKQRFSNSTLAIGRQSIDWGSGRFWQPLNVFGSFAPTDLDTDYKAGIDALRLDWFPSDLSSLSAVYAFAPTGNTSIDNSAAIHYRRQLGEQGELAVVAGDIIGNTVVGASYANAWGGMGWSIEAAHYQEKNNNDFVFWIAGLYYQFSNGVLVNAEWYHNSRGANSIDALISTNIVTDQFINYGLQQQLSQDVFGLSLNKDLTPLWSGSYTLLASPLDDNNGKLHTSLLHQVNLTYSVSNESDLLFSVLKATGRGATSLAQAQSEFGHTPASITLRLRFYF
jgi:hypothetical protein